jgi:4-hydroxy-tetrahydrodipicolinate synthase
MLDDIADSVAGFLVGGSVGEISSLTVDERIELLRAVAARREDHHTLCFSIADNSLENTRRLAAAAAAADVDLVMVSAPNYFGVSVAAFEEYLSIVAHDVAGEMCLYDNPVATHMSLSVEDIARLGRNVKSLTHVKVTDTALGKVRALRGAAELQVLAGDDAVLWHQLTEGAAGAMVALPLICPQRTADFWAAFTAGDLDHAFALYAPAAGFIHAALGGADYVAVIKEAMVRRGVIASSEVRPPLVALEDDRRREVGRALAYLEEATAASGL